MAMALSSSCHWYWFHDITFHNEHIKTTVTDKAAVVDDWIANTYRIHWSRLHKLIIGIDTKWRATTQRGAENLAATLQLCVGHRCLVFQLLIADTIPGSLYGLLNNQNFTFVGAWLKRDLKKLSEGHGLIVARTMDLGYLAALSYDRKEFKRMSREKLALLILRKTMDRPKNVIMSWWDDFKLSAAQVQLASIDAFVAFEIGMRLYWPNG